MGRVAAEPTFHAWQTPAYKVAFERLQGLRLRALDVETRIDEQLARMAERRDTDHRHARAEAMAAGEPEPAAVDIPPTLAALYEERRVLALAVEMAERRRDLAEAEASRAICARARPQYLTHVKRILAAAAALVDAMEAEEAFVRDLTDGGTRFMINRHNWAGIPSREAVAEFADDARAFFPEIGL